MKAMTLSLWIVDSG